MQLNEDLSDMSSIQWQNELLFKLADIHTGRHCWEQDTNSTSNPKKYSYHKSKKFILSIKCLRIRMYQVYRRMRAVVWHWGWLWLSPSSIAPSGSSSPHLEEVHWRVYEMTPWRPEKHPLTGHKQSYNGNEKKKSKISEKTGKLRLKLTEWGHGIYFCPIVTQWDNLKWNIVVKTKRCLKMATNKRNGKQNLIFILQYWGKKSLISKSIRIHFKQIHP